MDTRIVSAAMLMDDGLVVPGVRHFSPDMRAVLRRIYGSGLKVFGMWIRKPYHFRVKEQGFIDNRGNFLSREAAWKVADTESQIWIYDPAGKGRSFRRRGCMNDSEILFSENLY